MTRFSKWLAGAVAALGLCLASDAQADGNPRYLVGGHPYHNGNLFIPPSSAYEATRVFPPVRYGFPSYYYPPAYLAPGSAYMHTYPWYPGVPAGRAGGYYMSAYGYYHTANW